jgi:hypothetical protein
VRPYDGVSLCTAGRFPMVAISPRLCSGRLKGRNPCRTLEPYPGPASSLLITSLIFAPSIRRSASLPLWASSITPPSGQRPCVHLRTPYYVQNSSCLRPTNNAGPFLSIHGSKPLSVPVVGARSAQRRARLHG